MIIMHHHDQSHSFSGYTMQPSRKNDMKNNLLILLTGAMAIAAPACKKTDTVKDIVPTIS